MILMRTETLLLGVILLALAGCKPESEKDKVPRANTGFSPPVITPTELAAAEAVGTPLVAVPSSTNLPPALTNQPPFPTNVPPFQTNNPTPQL